LITPKIPLKIKREFTETRIIETEKIEQLPSILHGILHKFDVVNLHNDPAQICVYPRMRPSVWMCNEPPIDALIGGEIDEKYKQIIRDHIDINVVADRFNQTRFMELFNVEARINHYGVDHDFFVKGNPENIIEKYSLGDRFTVLQVGMFTFTKNQLKTVGLFKKIKKRIPEAKLVLAGYNDTPYFKKVKQRIVQSRLIKDVVFTGEVSQTEIRDLYHASNVLIVPIMPQGGWLSTFEAMTAGLPVVVSPQMTASDIITDNDLGLVTEDYVEAVFALYGKRRRTVKPGRWVKKHLTWERFCGNMLDYFVEVMP